jgi:hypothetical protein
MISLHKKTIGCERSHGHERYPPSPSIYSHMGPLLGSVGAYQKSLVTARSLRSKICPFNAFTGSIPEELADLEAIATIFVEGNKLTGHIPDWIRNRASVRSISLAENMFRGPLPALPLQHLVSSSAETNQLSGSIPAEICQANSLRTKRLHSILLFHETKNGATLFYLPNTQNKTAPFSKTRIESLSSS